jgi:hypothetical protein
MPQNIIAYAAFPCEGWGKPRILQSGQSASLPSVELSTFRSQKQLLRRVCSFLPDYMVSHIIIIIIIISALSGNTLR